MNLNYGHVKREAKKFADILHQYVGISGFPEWIIAIVKLIDPGVLYGSDYEAALIEIRDAINARIENKRW